MLAPSAGTLRCIECGESRPRAGEDSVFTMGSGVFPRGGRPLRRLCPSLPNRITAPGAARGMLCPGASPPSCRSYVVDGDALGESPIDPGDGQDARYVPA